MNKQCAYCGDVGIVTRDHVPPKGIFPKPRPANLITVPACPKCHSQQTSRDDEYFRNTLNVREDLSKHPGVLKVQPVVLRSFSNPNKSGMLGEFLKSIRLIEQVTPAGIIIKNKIAASQDNSFVESIKACCSTCLSMILVTIFEVNFGSS